MKRILSLILSAVVILSVSPLTFAEENYGENIALGKPVYSDTPFGQGFDVKYIVDGDLSTDGAVEDTASSDVRNGYRNYMIVDLGETYELNRVIIRTRRGIDAAWVRVGLCAVAANKADFSDAVMLGAKQSAGEYASDMNAKVNNVKARYVMAVNTKGYGHFAIADLEIYGDVYSGEGTGDYDDIANHKQQNAAKLLFGLGIMDGVDKTTFGTENLMTRAEAAELICKFAGISSGQPVDTSFADVKSDNPYSGYIKGGLEYGFISKSDKFRPDDYVLDCEFLKMVLCINGYLMQPVTNTGYPQMVYELASSTDLIKGTEGIGLGNGEYMNRANAAIVLYNALIGKSFEFDGDGYSESEETLLEKLYDCTLMRGIVTGNGASKLDEKCENVYLNTIEIDNTVYSMESQAGISFLGEAVYFVLDEDDSVVNIWEDEARTKKVKIYAEDIEEADFDVIKTGSTNKLTRYNIDAHPYKIFNDVADASVTEASLKPQNGYLTLVDNDNDGVYEIVKIYKPQILLVDSISSDEAGQKLSISGTDGEKLTLNYGSLSVIRADGKPTTVDKLKSGTMIYAYVSGGEEVVRIQMQSLSKSGTLKSVGSEELNISGTVYETTEYFRSKFTGLEIGSDIEFYLDENEKIIYIIDDEILKNSEILAVIQRFLVDEAEEIENIMVYDSDMKFRELKLRERVSVDGDKKSKSEIAAMNRDYFEGKLAVLKLSGEDEISSIITENDTNGDLAPMNKTLSEAYRGNAGIYSGTTLVLPVTDNIPVFTIPVDSTGRPHISSEFTNIYNVTDLKTSYRVRTKFNNGSEFGVYGANDFGEPSVLVRKRVYDESSTEYGTISNYLAPDCMVFDYATESLGADGGICYELIGYDIVTGAKKTVKLKSGLKKVVNTYKIRNASWYSSEIPEEFMPDEETWMSETKVIEQNMLNEYFLDDITDIERGDIIRYSNGSYDSVAELELVVKNMDITPSKCGVVYAAGDLPSTILATYRMQYAFAKKVRDGHITFEASEGVEETLDLSFFDGNVVVVNDRYVESYPISSAGVCINPNDRIVVYSNAGYHKSIVVYK